MVDVIDKLDLPISKDINMAKSAAANDTKPIEETK